jgi:hypothetical protein
MPEAFEQHEQEGQQKQQEVSVDDLSAKAKNVEVSIGDAERRQNPEFVIAHETAKEVQKSLNLPEETRDAETVKPKEAILAYKEAFNTWKNLAVSDVALPPDKAKEEEQKANDEAREIDETKDVGLHPSLI